ncbi:hypothetical protein O181_010728 [Austropuccinia psidii MF-1]|uniref:Uncharacterized protein n=1 Tax=Austropuccinia psidii MF-1 TaxID=1389203 RepID=A0A9Q3BTX1_9BASI|nr:hypothetical protein [Austropuccinia psidii MF-1]
MHELASVSLPNPLLPLRCLRSRTTLKICLCGGAPISALTPPYNTGLILNSAYHPYAPAAPSICDSNATPHLLPHHSLCLCTPAAYNPYAPVVPSR